MAKVNSTNNLVVGMDIGTTKIATVIGYLNDNNQIDILGFGTSESTGVEFGEIRNLNKTTDGIILANEMAVQRAKQPIESVCVGIAGHHIKTYKYNHILYRHGNNDPISDAEIEKLIDEVRHVTVNPGEEIIDVIPQYFILDNKYNTTEPVGQLASVVTGFFQLITGNTVEINKIVRCVQNANVDIREIILEPIASGLACLNEEEKKQGVALVDIGGGTTDIVIFYGGNPVFTKVIPIGGNIVTKDIATVCKISEDIAEKLKIKYGTCIVNESNTANLITIPMPYGHEAVQINEAYLAQIINSRVQEEIVNVVAKEIANSGYQNKLLAGLVITGGGAELKHIKELFQYTLNMPIRKGVPENGFARNVQAELINPKYSTALGLLKYGLSQQESQPVEEETKPKRQKKEKVKKDKESKNGRGIGGIFEGVGPFFDNLLENLNKLS